LAALERAARGTENTMPRILRCVESLCTLGEISDTLRLVFGEATELGAL
jgi:methylmalonyl-CoA mutase N-terminal domain/subunit